MPPSGAPPPTVDRPAIERTAEASRGRLLDLRTPDGCWVGELASSALATATAALALALVDRAAASDRRATLVRQGLDWLAANQNADGGWGDTVLSRSHVSTTLLGWSALSASPRDAESLSRAGRRAADWLRRRAGGLDATSLVRAVEAAYGRDRTFSAPILTAAALAGRLGPAAEAWRRVRPLPFELAACPHRWYRRLRLPVVSYALPALVAIGQVRHHFRPPWNPLRRRLRDALRARTLDVLADLQPSSGGFLEATPLTSFVVMSLAAMGRADHVVARRGAAFLAASARPDGSWPIDTNLATWVTTLAVGALAAGGRLAQHLAEPARRQVLDRLLTQQHRCEHPYTHAAPGGWAWTDLAGGVPDADDTAGALVALAHLGVDDPRSAEAAEAGVRWLLDLQNRDGGVPTFCRGWGALPFDRSAADLTAHALAAWAAWRDRLPAAMRPRVEAATRRALAFLRAARRPDGSWVPLWFGNAFVAGNENPTYGTARVVAALEAPAAQGSAEAAAMRTGGLEWLLRAQAADGGWGGAPDAPASIEETALAAHALAGAALGAAGSPGVAGAPDGSGAGGAPGMPAGPAAPGAAGAGPGLDGDRLRGALARAAAWLVERTAEGTRFDPSPIGFYFATLWYFERLYPVVFTVAALERLLALPDA